jgi:16S rRNA (uracil1498-N3)-methyltransferase
VSTEALASRVTFVLHEDATVPLSTVELPVADELVLAVGPEGGIAPEELDRFVSAGAIPVRLGDTVLRTSTAGVAALAALSIRLGRW